jgi:hypothetical protein
MKRSILACSWVFALAGVLCAGGALTAYDDDDVPPGDVDSGAPIVDGAVDADPLEPDADPNAPDAADTENGPDGAVGVSCGTMTCTGDDQCCITQAQGGGGAEYSCIAPDGECQGGGTLACDGPEDCDGNACCGAIGGGGGAGAECSEADSCAGAAIQLCHNNDDCPTPQNGEPHCCPSMFGSFCLPFGNACP